MEPCYHFSHNCRARGGTYMRARKFVLKIKNLGTATRFHGISNKVLAKKLPSKWALRWNIVEKLFITQKFFIHLYNWLHSQIPGRILLAREGPIYPSLIISDGYILYKNARRILHFTRLQFNVKQTHVYCTHAFVRICAIIATVIVISPLESGSLSVTSGCSRVMHYCSFTRAYVELQFVPECTSWRYCLNDRRKADLKYMYP